MELDVESPRWSLLKRLVETKLDAAGVLGTAKRERFGSNPLGLSADNSLLLEFTGVGSPPRYRLLVSFLPIDLNSTLVQRHVARSKDLLLFDLALFCIPAELSGDDLFRLKQVGVHVLSLSFSELRGGAYQSIPDFIHVPGMGYSELLEANLLGNEITKRLRKKFHLVLSELAAASYTSYGTFATKTVMAYEDEVVRAAIEGLQQGQGDKGGLAIDVGCGDGRHTRLLARHFSEVIGFDISSRMLEAARSIDRDTRVDGVSPVTYYECDVEYEEFPDEIAIKGKADFVCASFGMPSFVEDTAAFARRVYGWLRPRGRALFTFYNAQSIALSIATPWRERALSASIDLVRNALDVELREDVRFSIYCRAYDSKIRDVISGPFRIERELTFPHLLAFLPPSVFGTDERPKQDVRDLVQSIDRTIADDTIFGRGHYVFLVVEKADFRREGRLKVQAALDRIGIQYEFLTHDEVLTMSDARRVLNLEPGEMIKTVIMKRSDIAEFIVILLAGSSRVDNAAVAVMLGCSPENLVLAPLPEIEVRFGFSLGGISPFGYEGSTRLVMDQRVARLKRDWLYMGAGESIVTLRMTNEAFREATKGYEVANIALP